MRFCGWYLSINRDVHTRYIILLCIVNSDLATLLVMTILNYEILRSSKQEKDRDSTHIGNNTIYYVVRKIRKTRVEETRVYTKQQVCGTHDCSVST